MLKLLKEAKTKPFRTEYCIKLFAEDGGKFSTYANNSNFNWGWVRIFDTKEEAENDFYDSLKMFNYYKWEVK